MYIISVKSHDYPTCTHYYIRFTQIQKLGPRQAYLFAQDKQSNSVTELIRKSDLIPKHVTISLCHVPSHKTVPLTHSPSLDHTFCVQCLLKSSQLPVRWALSPLF